MSFGICDLFDRYSPRDSYRTLNWLKPFIDALKVSYILWFVIGILFECDIRTRLLKIRVDQWLCFIEFEQEKSFLSIAVWLHSRSSILNISYMFYILYSITLYVRYRYFIIILLGEIHATAKMTIQCAFEYFITRLCLSKLLFFAYIISKVIAMQRAMGITISVEQNCPNREKNFEEFTFDHCKLYFHDALQASMVVLFFWFFVFHIDCHQNQICHQFSVSNLLAITNQILSQLTLSLPFIFLINKYTIDKFPVSIKKHDWQISILQRSKRKQFISIWKFLLKLDGNKYLHSHNPKLFT